MANTIARPCEVIRFSRLYRIVFSYQPAGAGGEQITKILQPIPVTAEYPFVKTIVFECQYQSRHGKIGQYQHQEHRRQHHEK